MLDVVLVGWIMIAITGGIVSLGLAIGECMYKTKDGLRIAAIIFTVPAVLGWLWPIALVVAVVAGVGYGLFTTARVVRHRGFDF